MGRPGSPGGTWRYPWGYHLHHEYSMGTRGSHVRPMGILRIVMGRHENFMGKLDPMNTPWVCAVLPCDAMKTPWGNLDPMSAPLARILLYRYYIIVNCLQLLAGVLFH